MSTNAEAQSAKPNEENFNPVRSAKYYTPTKSDLIYGLEFEETYNDIDWSPKVINDDLYMGMEDWSGDLFDFIGAAFYKPSPHARYKVRVKYLDEQDIKSIGGKLTHEQEGNPNKMYYFGEHSLIFNYRNRRCVITIRNNDRQEDYTAYVGIIKNKAELKRLFDNFGVPYK